MDTVSLSPKFGRPQASHALWRNSQIEAILAHGEVRKPVLAALRKHVGPLRQEARALVDELEAECASNSVVAASEHARGRGARDCLATDLIASAILLDAVDGRTAAGHALDYLRRQRGFRPVPWTAWSRDRHAEGAESAHEMGDLAAPQP